MIFNGYAEGREELAGLRLVSCGHVFAEPGREIYRPEGRDDWLLFFVEKEEETFFFDRPCVAKAGSFVLFAPGERQHHMYRGQGRAEFYYVHFRADALPRDLALRTSCVYTLTYRKHYADLFEQILGEVLEKRQHYELLSLSRLLYILSLVCREAAQLPSPENRAWHSVERAVAHINRHPDSNLDLGDYAEMCCMSKYHFLRVFREVTGATPMEYRSRSRIEHAKELLHSGDLSVAEIAETLGYSSLAYFSAQFKRVTGVSPSAYRRGRGGENLCG